jgi:hypothetical protein
VNPIVRASFVICTVAAAALGSVGLATAQPANAPTPRVVAKPTEVTGQHRGFTNEKLFLLPDDGKEMMFVVDIAGDKDRKWQKDFATGSRITVSYIPGAPDGPLIAKSLRKAAEAAKK